MINSFVELQYIAEAKKHLLATTCSKKHADYLTSRYKKRTEKFCKRNKGFFKCRQCKGAGLLKLRFHDLGIELLACHVCKLTGVETWLDKMIGGWKISV